MAMGPRCLRCWMFMESGPVDLLVLLEFIASFISSGVRVKVGSGLSCLIVRSILRYVLLVWWGTLWVNW